MLWYLLHAAAHELFPLNRTIDLVLCSSFLAFWINHHQMCMNSFIAAWQFSYHIFDWRDFAVFWPIWNSIEQFFQQFLFRPLTILNAVDCCFWYGHCISFFDTQNYLIFWQPLMLNHLGIEMLPGRWTWKCLRGIEWGVKNTIIQILTQIRHGQCFSVN